MPAGSFFREGADLLAKIVCGSSNWKVQRPVRGVLARGFVVRLGRLRFGVKCAGAVLLASVSDLGHPLLAVCICIPVNTVGVRRRP